VSYTPSPERLDEGLTRLRNFLTDLQHPR
jgi:hypothetical protein